jgi:nitrilase
MSTKTSVAIIQARSVYYDLEACIEKAISLIREAAKQGAKVITLGETWFPGYPAWIDYCPNVGLWNHPPTKAVFARLYANSMSIPGKELIILQNVAKELGVTLILGINERVDSGTLYNSLLVINDDGQLVNHHRKLMPTYTERLVWGQGDGAGLQASDTSAGRVSGLICWEHWMPLARQTLHNASEQIHTALWPTVHEMHQVASRHYAFEGRCFVLAAGCMMTVSDLPSELDIPVDLAATPERWLLRGGSAIIAPDGRYIVPPCYDDETILTAEIDLDEVIQEKMTLDVSGHYQRLDVFTFDVSRERR